jgi:hypothetical protein
LRLAGAKKCNLFEPTINLQWLMKGGGRGTRIMNQRVLFWVTSVMIFLKYESLFCVFNAIQIRIRQAQLIFYSVTEL